jgi:nucleoside-diphosphate-sugar epimerase
VPLLDAAGHEVVALSRSGTRPADTASTRAEDVTADALDARQIGRAVRHAAPDAVVNMLIAIPAELNPRKLARQFSLTNRLCTEGTCILLDAAHAAGATRFVSQSLAYAYQPGDGAADEGAPLWTKRTPKQFAPVLEALVEHERRTTEAGGLVLRLGHLYGPGSIYAADGSFAVRRRPEKCRWSVEGTRCSPSFTPTTLLP